MSSEYKQIAVLTGDLVHSTELGPKKIARAFEALENCAAVQKGWLNAPLHFTRHRGDGWQVALARPEMALRSALAFRAALRALGQEFDTYIGCSEDDEGPVQLSPDLNEETGDVFQHSGMALSWSKNGETHRMSYHPVGPMNAVFILADKLSKDWTQPQAAAILPFLAPVDVPTATDVAKQLNKSRQAVSKALDAAAYSTLLEAMTNIEVSRQYG